MTQKYISELKNEIYCSARKKNLLNRKITVNNLAIESAKNINIINEYKASGGDTPGV